MLKSPAYKNNAGSDPLLDLPGRDELSAHETKTVVSEAVASLKPIYREAAILHFYNGFTVKEAAKIANVPETAMAYRVRRSKALLRERLGEWYFGE